jgi:hypothetical protein
MAGSRRLTRTDENSVVTEVAWQLAQRALTTSLDRRHASAGREAEP